MFLLDTTMAAAAATAKKKELQNNWSFVLDHIEGGNKDDRGNFKNDTMLCFKKHGTLALSFHANFDSGIVCSKCFQFMKPGSFALHCEKCAKQPSPMKKDIGKWADSDKKWADLKRQNMDLFQDKTVIRIARRDGLSAYVIHPRFYLGKSSSTLVLKALCITDGCSHVCALNALHRHFKQAHMTGTYGIQPLQVLEAPLLKKIEESDDSSSDSDDGQEDVGEGGKNGDNEEDGNEASDSDDGHEDVQDVGKNLENENDVNKDGDSDDGHEDDQKGGKNSENEVSGNEAVTDTDEDMGEDNDCVVANAEGEQGGMEENENSPEDVEETTTYGGKADDKNEAVADADNNYAFNRDTCVEMEDNAEKTTADGEDIRGEMPPFDDVDDMDCEPFVDEGGPSDDDTAAEHEKVRANKEKIRKKKTTAGRTMPVRKSTRNRRAASRFN